jgi:hypothetical protein
MKYVIEPIETTKPRSWGDVDPATKELTGHYNGKTKGAVKPSDSKITEENGYKNIVILPAGVSPAEYIKSKEQK